MRRYTYPHNYRAFRSLINRMLRQFGDEAFWLKAPQAAQEAMITKMRKLVAACVEKKEKYNTPEARKQREEIRKNYWLNTPHRHQFRAYKRDIPNCNLCGIENPETNKKTEEQ